MKKLNDVFLHEVTRHTNIEIPYSDFVQSNKFPEQISELLNTKVTIKYRNHYRSDLECINRAAVRYKDGVKVSSRPSDDIQMMEDDTPAIVDVSDQTDIYSGKFIVVRADKTEPYVMIGIKDDYSAMVINSTEIDDSGEYKFYSKISEYATQMNEFIGLQVFVRFMGNTNERIGAIFSVDATEPCHSIIMELLDETTVRFILDNEAMAIVDDYYALNGENDYNGKRAPELPGWVDVDGWYASYANLLIPEEDLKDINGGTSNKWYHFYENAFTNEQVAEFRKKVLEGMTIYGTI